MRLDVGDDAGRGLGLREEHGLRAAELAQARREVVGARRLAPLVAESTSVAARTPRRSRPSARRSSRPRRRPRGRPASRGSRRRPPSRRCRRRSKSSTSGLVRMHLREALEAAAPSTARNSAVRWWTSGRCIAASTSGGTGVGPGVSEVALAAIALTRVPRRRTMRPVEALLAFARGAPRPALRRRARSAAGASGAPRRSSPGRPRSLAYAVASGALAWGAAAGWNDAAFRVYYLGRRAPDRAAPRRRARSSSRGSRWAGAARARLRRARRRDRARDAAHARLRRNRDPRGAGRTSTSSRPRFVAIVGELARHARRRRRRGARPSAAGRSGTR